MKRAPGYEHRVASHCETGSVRNLLEHRGLAVSEPMVFGIGSGPLFYYLFFAKGPATFPLIGIRNPPSAIVRNFAKLCGVDFSITRHRSTASAIASANALLEAGIPCTATVDMFRMKYLPSFLRVHAPFHFIVLIGRDGDTYAVSDPYSSSVGTLSREDLEAAWETHAPMAKDNLLCYVRAIPDTVDWKGAIRRALKRTANAMILPPGVAQLVWFAGIQGMRAYAKRMRRWPSTYRGVALREGMIFNAIAFEDQGTGGAAFRLMYGAFLDEAATLFGSDELRELSGRILEHGRRWRAASRELVLLARGLPMSDDAFDDWMATHGPELGEGLEGVARHFDGFADFEAAFFRDLKAAAGRLS